jgi:hypothetical protein
MEINFINPSLISYNKKLLLSRHIDYTSNCTLILYGPVLFQQTINKPIQVWVAEILSENATKDLDYLIELEKRKWPEFLVIAEGREKLVTQFAILIGKAFRERDTQIVKFSEKEISENIFGFLNEEEKTSFFNWVEPYKGITVNEKEHLIEINKEKLFLFYTS